MIKIQLTAVYLTLAALSGAELLPEAVQTFPAQTTAIEYDALSSLRKLPNFANLRKQYSSKGLEKVQKALSQLAISEDQLTDATTASGPGGFFGLLHGSFQSLTAAREAVRHGLTKIELEGVAAYCTKDDVCFFFPPGQKGRLLFASPNQLKAISAVRQGHQPSLRNNPSFMKLLSRVDPQAPLFGIAPGREINGLIGSAIPEALAARLELNRLISSIEVFSYSMKLDSKAHVGLNLICTSETAGTALRDALSAAGGLQRVAAMAGGGAMFPFENLAVSSTGRWVTVKMDARLD